MTKDPLLWPYIEVRVRDLYKEENVFSFGKGCEDSFTTLSLIDFVDKE